MKNEQRAIEVMKEKSVIPETGKIKYQKKKYIYIYI